MKRLKNSIGLKLTILSSAVFFIFVWITGVIAVEYKKVDINELVHDTQRMSKKPEELTLVWWIPEEYWRVSMSNDPSITESQIDEFMKVLRPYTFVAVVDGSMGAFGGITYKPEESIRAEIRIRDSGGKLYSPLSNDDIQADTKNFLSMMRPVFVNMLGPLGQNMHFILFPVKDEKGKQLAEATKDGSFSVDLGERAFKWKLPLGSLLPKKICPVCGEELSGAYKYCPWDGTKLPDKKE